ncbi:MAG: hypothetical protein AAF990_00765 [Bacteroidota bacterium]
MSKIIEEQEVILKIILIEDEIKIARALKRVLKEKLEPNLHAKKFEFIHVRTVEEFKTIDASPENKYIIDLNLNGPNGYKDGLGILQKLLSDGNDMFRPIVYTATDNLGVKNRCLELGVWEDHFLSKRNLRRDLNTIENLIYRDFREYIANLNEFGLTARNSPSQSTETNLPDARPNSTEQSDIEDSYKMKEEDNLKAQDFSDNSDVLNIPDEPKSIIPMRLEAQYISVYSDLFSIYDQLPFNARIAVCKYFLEPFHNGYNFYGLAGEVFDLKVARKGYARDQNTLRRTKYFALNLLQSDTRQIEKITWYKGKEVIQEIDFSDLENIKAHYDGRFGKLKSTKDFLIDLSELFAARRLAELYLKERKESERLKILDQAYNLNIGFGRMSFMTILWEEMTEVVTEDAEETQEELQPLVEKGFLDIEEIFYCKITDIDTDNKVVDTEVFSLEDTDNSFPRAFDLKLLKKAGIYNPDACFKLIILNNEPNHKNPSGRTFFIEPIPVAIYHQKLDR